MNLKIQIILLLVTGLLWTVSCDPLVTSFEDREDAEEYMAKNIITAPSSVNILKVMTWNIRFGAGRLPWFGDSNGDRVIMTDDEVLTHLEMIVQKLESFQADIVMIQEIDVGSKRSAYIDQLQWILDHSYFNYASFASNWKAQVIPSDGLGRLEAGNAILSRWPISYSERIKLDQRGDQSALVNYFYLRRNILKSKIEVPGLDNFYVVNVHAAAFATDDTKIKHIHTFVDELDKLEAEGVLFIAGGDLNSLPPGAIKTDYCLEDKGDDESYHQPGDDPEHKEGSYFGADSLLLDDLFTKYSPAVPNSEYLQNEPKYFTHTPDWTGVFDRKLDYLFTNSIWVAGSDSTHQDAAPASDHCPVTAEWEVSK